MFLMIGAFLGGWFPARRRGCLQVILHGVWEVSRGLAPASVNRVRMPRLVGVSLSPRCVRYGGPGHLDLDALQRASDRVVARHSALRTTQSRDEAMREAMDRAGAMWQPLVCRLHELWRYLKACGARGASWDWNWCVVCSCC